MSQEINAGPLRFTATLGGNESEEARRYAELNRAASEAKEHSYDEAVELLRQAKALKGDLYEDSRLAKFLQTAGRFDEAMAEVQWLIDRAGIQAQHNAAQQSATVQQMQRVNYLIKAHEAGALICKRDKRPELRAGYEQRLEKLWALHEKLSALVDAENEARWAAREKEREARRAGSQAAPVQAVPSVPQPAPVSAARKVGRTCLKCGHVNVASTGDGAEACPQCGAIYSRVEAAMAPKAEAMRRPQAERPARVIEEYDEAASHGVTQRQLIGLVGAAVLAIGVFMPLLSGPMGTSVNMFNNGNGYGASMLALAAGSAGLVLTRRYRLLWGAGAAVLVVLAVLFARVQAGISKAREIMEQELKGNPFRFLADSAMESMQMQWGWAVLVIGAAMLLGCAGMKKG